MSTAVRVRYSREFLLSVAPRCRARPDGIDAALWQHLGAAARAAAAAALAPPSGRAPDAGRWRSRAPVAAPLHRAGSAYRPGATLSADPREEKSQKTLKSLLNKITPDNFDRILPKIAAEIERAVTLRGFIDQVFDKALQEPKFSELYSTLVAKLDPLLPELADDGAVPVRLRRQLVNKCQEEFEAGARAAAEAEAEAEADARRRTLGNVVFVGHLYTAGVLSEGVIHACIRQLLADPRPEDVERACALVRTVGARLEASTKSVKRFDELGNATGSTPARDAVRGYFERVAELARDRALDSRHRFMLLDLLDLRRDGWVERRATERPSKIEDVHRFRAGRHPEARPSAS